MQKLTFITYGVWAVACIVLKILGLCSWWFATSFIWFPGGVYLSMSLIMFLIPEITYRAKEKTSSKIPDSCSICLFSQTREFAKDGKCLGERKGREYGKMCEYYRRHLGN